MPPVIKFGSRLGALATVWVLLSSTAMATPTTVPVDEFAVSLDGTPIFDDSFNSNTSLARLIHEHSRDSLADVV